MTTYCKYCNEEIAFDDDYISECNGKKIPLDTDTMEPHDCPDSPYHHQNRIVECWNCGEEITFADDMVSKSRKKIPLDPETYHPHWCEEEEYDDEDEEYD